MKSLSKILLAVWLLGAVDANAELKQFTYFSKAIPGKKYTDILEVNNILEIKSGEVFVPISGGSSSQARVVYPDGSNEGLRYYMDTTSHPGTRPIIGPALIEFNDRYNLNSDSSLIFIYDHQKTTISNSSPSLPSNTVVIPTDASGPVEIVMESSKDLVNWTRAEPGTYGADTPKRFFRVRAVVKP